MRLIDVNTLELKEFFGRHIPRYAILSHTWNGDKEVTFQEWERHTDNAIRCKEGYAKIVGACRRAQADGLQYLWCDTNCIDKRSSAELSEAINSMFAWYHDSDVCYAYLADVRGETDTCAKSRWFTRGWTLQELLAPSKVIFFDHYWTVLGERGEMASMISDITRIHIGPLKDRSTIYNYSVAQRMSWAANRQTTREEDISYCLLGLFDINMPLLYGEGPKAFYRLQREIIKVSDDQSVLAWDLLDSDRHPWTGALAVSPAEFRFCGSIVTNHETQRSAYSITNLGLSMRLAVITTFAQGIVLVGLNCAKEMHPESLGSHLPDTVQCCRHFRVWVPLLHLKHETYIRAHYPSSTVFLGRTYPILERPVPTDLFISLDISQTRAVKPLEDPARMLRQYPTCLPSGLLTMFASGKMTPGGCVFKDVYPLGDILIVQLKHRAVSTVSHQLISSGNLAIIFSVFWSKDGLPQQWLHTTIVDPKLKISCQMTSQVEWNCLFETSSHERSASCCNSAVGMRSLHSRLQKLYEKPLAKYVKEEKDPVVTVETRPLMDSFGQPELIVDIVFRETPKSIYSPSYIVGN
ncbi:HET-domain-containing protein [Hypoxylon sp. NC0597]|nr:HET-domain-containing protein [Hypoxylon sp. NC0597]